MKAVKLWKMIMISEEYSSLVARQLFIWQERWNMWVWGLDFPHLHVELERDLPKTNVYYATSKTKVYVASFFHWADGDRFYVLFLVVAIIDSLFFNFYLPTGQGSTLLEYSCFSQPRNVTLLDRARRSSHIALTL